MRVLLAAGESSSAAAPDRRAALAGTLLVAVLAIAPFWTVRNVATVDGPAHFLNAGIFRSLLVDGASPYRPFYAISWTPLPYWTQTVALSLLLELFSPPTANRLLLSTLVVLLPLSVAQLRIRLHGEAGAPALLAFPLATGYLLHLGLYNFCLGTALLLFFLAFYWREPEPGPARIVALAGWLLLLWFTHLVAWGVAAGALVGAAALLARRRRRLAPLASLAALLPTLPLAGWYLVGVIGQPPRGAPSFEALLDHVLAGGIFVGYARSERIGVPLLLLPILGLIGSTILGSVRNRRATEATLVFGAAAATALLLTIVAPRRLADGSLLRPRFAFLFVLFVLAVAAAPKVRALSFLLFAATLGFEVYRLAAVVPAYRLLDGEIRAMESCLAEVRPGERVLASWLRPPPTERNPHFPLPPNAQGIAWDALDRGWIDFGNPFPSRSFTPVRERREAIAHSRPSPESTPTSWAAAYDVEGYDVLFFWGFPRSWSTNEEFQRRFALRSSCPAGGVAVRRALGSPPDSKVR
jgi:hypothetical protein